MSTAYGDIKNRADIVRRIDLEEILERIGSFRHSYDKSKWHTSQGVLSVRGEKFINWAAGIGGGGAIDLVIHLMEYDFKAAVNWLCRNFSPIPIGVSYPNHQEMEMDRDRDRDRDRQDSKTLKLPARDDGKLPQIRQYLMHQRCLPKATVNYLIRRGILYADDKGNAVFLLLGKEKRVVGAEIRGTNDNLRKWRGMATGSKKNLGCFYIRARGANKVVICESAIDAISYFVLHSNSNSMAVSTSGATPNPAWLSLFIDKGFEIFCGFDADDTGNRMADSMIKLYPGIKRLRPAKQDWNEVLKARFKVK